MAGGQGRETGVAAGTVQARAVAAETGDAEAVRSGTRGCSQPLEELRRCTNSGHGASLLHTVSGQKEYGSSIYNACNCSVNWRFFQNKILIKKECYQIHRE